MKMLAPLLTVALLAACAQNANDAETAAVSPEATAPTAAEPAVSPAAPTAAPEDQPMDMAGGDAAAAGTTATASGTVESVDAAAGKIVIAHGPVEALSWPAMTMGFTATPDQVNAVQAGQKVEFEFLSQGANNTITRITPAQ